MRKVVINSQLIAIIPTVSCAKVLLSESITIGLQNIKNVLIGIPNKVSGVDLCDVVFWLMLNKGVIECIWLNLRHGLERTSLRYIYT